jgi:drug/metabolite transporter (DMT)-like permease
MKSSSAAWGWTAAVLSTVSFSIAAPIGTLLINLGFDPTTILLGRFWLAAILLFGTLAVTAPGKLRLPRSGWLTVGGGGLSMGVAVLLYFWSLTRLHTSIAAMLIALEPVTALLMLALRGERFTYRNTVRVLLGLAGVYLLVGVQGAADGLGVLMVLGVVVLSSFHTVSLQWFLGEHDGRAVTAYVVLIMALTITAFWLWQRPVVPPLTGPVLLTLGALALFGTYVARLLLFVGVKRLGSAQVTLLAPLETLLTVTWSVLFLGDRLTLIQLAGGALILLSAVLAVRRLGRVKVAAPTEAVEVIAEA